MTPATQGERKHGADPLLVTICTPRLGMDTLHSVRHANRRGLVPPPPRPAGPRTHADPWQWDQGPGSTPSAAQPDRPGAYAPPTGARSAPHVPAPTPWPLSRNRRPLTRKPLSPLYAPARRAAGTPATAPRNRRGCQTTRRHRPAERELPGGLVTGLAAGTGRCTARLDDETARPRPWAICIDDRQSRYQPRTAHHEQALACISGSRPRSARARTLKTCVVECTWAVPDSAIEHLGRAEALSRKTSHNRSPRTTCDPGAVACAEERPAARALT